MGGCNKITFQCEPIIIAKTKFYTVKPLTTDPPKSGQPLYDGRTAHLPLIDFTIGTNTFRTSEKWTPLNSEQRTLISLQRTLANTKLPPKMDSELR